VRLSVFDCKAYCFLILCIFCAALAVAQDQPPQVFISNSGDWQDVYSVMQYTTIAGGSGYFLVSARHSTLLLNQLNRENDYLIVSSLKSPYVIGYKPVLESRGFTKIDELKANNINLELAKKLIPGISDFIVIDDSYGYNAISVAPYAAISKSYVLFANKRNINQVYTFLKSRNVRTLIEYGQLDREVKDRLQEFSPEIISEQDRFLNNQKVLSRWFSLAGQMCRTRSRIIYRAAI